MNQKSLDKKKTGFRKMTADDLRRGIDLSKSISGFKVIETKSNENKTKELDWKKEFDNDCWDTKDGVMTVTYLMKGGNKVGKLTERVTKEMIKSYVKIRLTQQRTELLEEIKKMIDSLRLKEKLPEQGYELEGWERTKKYNLALDMVEKEIKNLLNKKDE